MIKNIIKKIERLVKYNRILQVKLIGCILLVIVAAMQGDMLKGLDKTVTKVNGERELVMQISIMEKKLRTKNLKLLKPESQIIAIRNILEGTSFRDETYQAIIDGEVYSAGDMIGDYKIINITMKTILLENNTIFDIKELSFPEKVEVEI